MKPLWTTFHLLRIYRLVLARLKPPRTLFDLFESVRFQIPSCRDFDFAFPSGLDQKPHDSSCVAIGGVLAYSPKTSTNYAKVNITV